MLADGSRSGADEREGRCVLHSGDVRPASNRARVLEMTRRQSVLQLTAFFSCLTIASGCASTSPPPAAPAPTAAASAAESAIPPGPLQLTTVSQPTAACDALARELRALNAAATMATAPALQTAPQAKRRERAERLRELGLARASRPEVRSRLERITSLLGAATLDRARLQAEASSADAFLDTEVRPCSEQRSTFLSALPPARIQQIVRAGFGTLRACYEEGLARSPKLQGRVTVRFVIGQDGRVSEAAPVSGAAAGSGPREPDLPDPAVVECMRQAFTRLTFDSLDADDKVTVVYPIIFNPGD
jgi:hypothetical protein